MIELHLFHVDWCGYCVQFLPIWNQLKQTEKGVKFIDHNLTGKPKLAQKQNITGYPTLRFKIEGRFYNYIGDRNPARLKSIIKKIKK